MSRIERGNTVDGAIRNITDARTFGATTFLNKQDINDRRGTKVFGDLKRRVDRQGRGTPLGRLANRYVQGEPGSTVLDLFRTKNTTPLYDDGLGDEDDHNVTLAVNRQVNRPGPQFDSIQMHEIAILFKNSEDNLNTYRIEGSQFTIQCNPLSIIPPSVYNYAIGQIQQREAKNYPELYRKRTPFDYWKDYSIDGIPDMISPIKDRSSVFCLGSSMVDGAGVCDQPTCTMLATMAARGRKKVINYWGSGVKPGSQVWAVIRKFEQSDYSYDYMLGNKVLTDHTGKRRAVSNDCETNPLRPYQLAFFALPEGGPVPPEYTHYYDEEGNQRFDGHLIKIGTVAEVPLGHVYRESNSRLKPFTGAVPLCATSHYTMTNDYAPMRRELITIILKPDDGVLPL